MFRSVAPELSLDEFERLEAAVLDGNEQWLGEVCELLERRATRAKERGSDEWQALVELQARTETEVQQGLLARAMTREQLVRKYTRGGKLTARVMPRFGVQQGDDLRPCDNARVSGHNEATAMHEKLVCESALVKL